MPRRAPRAGSPRSGAVSGETGRRPTQAKRKTARERGYTWDWEKARKIFLVEHPFCVLCDLVGLVVEATVVDHVIPHRGDMVLFWLRSNWQALCEACHNAKRGEEKGRR